MASSKPLCLDLFCGLGGCSVGYARAGFEVVGCDIEPQPDYPFEFWQRNVFSLTYEELLRFDLIVASPPCQGYCSETAIARKRGKKYPDLFPPTKRLLVATGKPYVLENVPGSPARQAIKLCGTSFGLGVFRHRLFESNVPLRLPEHRCSCKNERIGDGFVTVAGDSCTKEEALAGLGIDWVRQSTKHQVVQAIPPRSPNLSGGR